MSGDKLHLKIPLILLFFLSISGICLAAEEVSSEKKIQDEHVIINGDNVEYSTDNKEVTAQGNVEVNYKGAKLTCDKMKINTDTKDVEAEGNVRLDDKKMVIEGQKIIYNFQNKTGIIIDSNFRSNPYFGRSEKAKKVSDDEFIIQRGYMTTCNYDNPHYRMKSRKVNFFPGDKVQAKDVKFYVGKAPLLYLPRFNRSLRDPLLHVQIVQGKKKDGWGNYILTAWRYNLTDNISGRIYLDYREKMGIAEGLGTNYTTTDMGRGDLKLYYLQERNRTFPEGTPAEFERYFLRWRHKWEISGRENLTAEYYKIKDSKRIILSSTYNILKDFFLREYEKDPQPLSYVYWHRAFNYTNLDLIMQKRTNRWYTQVEKLPEVRLALPSLQIGETPFYLENNTQAANFNYKYAVPSDRDFNVNRLDTTNKFSLPMRLFFVNLNPYVMNRETYYTKDKFGKAILPRAAFYTGSDLSTKFYRTFQIKSNFLGLDINALRHIITPTIGYSYNHRPTISNSRLVQIDGIDSIGTSHSASLEISNKLQTKRQGQSVDLANLRVTNSYSIKPVSATKKGGHLSDFLFGLELIPYSWLRIIAATTYKHSGSRSDPSYKTFPNVNYDIGLEFKEGCSFAMGQRYQRKGSNELTYNLVWRFNPKWNFSLYHRREIGHDYSKKKGLREQGYSLSRDLHCWVVSLNYNVYRPKGETLWLVFRLKAFPEMEFDYNKEYNVPKPGSQAPEMIQ